MNSSNNKNCNNNINNNYNKTNSTLSGFELIVISLVYVLNDQQLWKPTRAIVDNEVFILDNSTDGFYMFMTFKLRLPQT